jgi:hypothetical protein
VVRSSGDSLCSTGSDDFVDAAMLADAIVKARKLVAEMEKQQREIDEAPPRTDLSPEQLAAGKFAFEKAIGSARRMLKALEDAQQIATPAQNDDNEPDANDAN